jgi:hypothetical protein
MLWPGSWGKIAVFSVPSGNPMEYDGELDGKILMNEVFICDYRVIFAIEPQGKADRQLL